MTFFYQSLAIGAYDAFFKVSSGGPSGKESACSSGDEGSILGPEDPLEEGLATHSNILAWRILWTEEPGGLQSMGLQRIGQLNRATTEAT